MGRAYINQIATAVPPHDVHQAFLQFASALLSEQPRKQALLNRMAEKAGIEHRYSFFSPPSSEADGFSVPAHEFYQAGNFPSTAARMALFAAQAPALAEAAINKLELGASRSRITHLVISCCTGFSAPGIDFAVIERCGLPSTVERTIVGFMGCCAAINTLKLARHIVRSEPDARVLVLNLELCSLHLNETGNLEELLSFLLFADGCAASLISADPVGIEMDSFRSVLVPDTKDQITWKIGDSGFDMFLSGHVPTTIQQALRSCRSDILAQAPPSAIDLWAVHPGGRTILDAVERAFDLPGNALAASREVLRRYGNMSSPTVMFVLESLMRNAVKGASGSAMAFGPGLVAETMLFHAAQ